MTDVKTSDRDCLKFYPDFLCSILERTGIEVERLAEAKHILVPIFSALLEDETAGGLCTTLEHVHQFQKREQKPADEVPQGITTKNLQELIDLGLACDAANDEALGSYPLVVDIEPENESASRVYLARSFLAEVALAKTIRALAATSRTMSSTAKETMDRLLATVPAETPLQKRSLDERRAAMSLVLENNFALIHGGPGTGKTTAVAGILECLLSENPNLNIKLAAPTGKAASRMLESIQGTVTRSPNQYPELAKRQNDLSSQTLHRLLYTIQPETGEKPSANAPLVADVLVIDETSMIGTLFAKNLFQALSANTRVILMGDADQLSAVEPGSAFADLCAIQNIGTTGRGFSARLSVSWRFNDQSVFGQLAQAVNAGEADKAMEILNTLDTQSPLKVHFERVPNSTEKFSLTDEAKSWIREQMRAYVKVLVDFIQKQGENTENLWKSLPSFRALSAMRQDLNGVYSLNGFAEECRLSLLTEFFGNETWKDLYGEDFGELLLVTKNNAQLDVYNGDIGIVLPYKTGENPQLYIGDRKKTIYLGQLSDLESAFALTIHKSQGSEFSKVAVFLPTDDESSLLSRELLYTAITRVKDSPASPGQVDLFVTEKSFTKAVESKTARSGGLKRRLERS